MDDVKGSRRERAAATRLKVIHAAHEEFVDKGFHGATIASIAKRAGVAAQTVYFVFHNKVELISAAIDTAVLGEETPTPPLASAWWAAAQAEPRPDEALRILIRGSAPIFARASGISVVLRAASSTDDELFGVHERSERLRYDGYRDMVRMIAAKGALKDGLDEDAATDLLFVLHGDTTYWLMTSEQGWSHDRFIEW